MVDNVMNDGVEGEEKASEPVVKKVVSRRRGFRRRAGDRSGNTSSTWLISFTDVMALMLTFFVLLFSMSHPKKEQWENFTHQVQKNFNKFQGMPLERGAQDDINIQKVNFSRALNLNYLQAIIANMIEQDPSLKYIKMIPMGSSLIISLPQNLLFDVGQATVADKGNQALFVLAGTLSRIKNRIEIVGHTDPRPVRGNVFPSNWELSLTRAANVGAVLEQAGYTRPVTVRGYASARYYDLPKAMSVAEKLDLSRRVDVVVMEDDGRRQRLFDLGFPSIE